MKKILLITLFALLHAICFGQNGGPLKFLGIPIDGPETQFSAKLKAKGFTYDSFNKEYHGQFNGQLVNVYIHTNHDLVDRVYVAFPFTSEDNIKSEFNHLLRQFKKTGKYNEFGTNEEIPDSDDISYEMSVNNKRYQASFYYLDPDRNPAELMSTIADLFAEFMTEEQLAILKGRMIKLVDLPEDQKMAFLEDLMVELQKMGLGQEQNQDPAMAIKLFVTFMDGIESIADGNVWFTIHKKLSLYQIGLYYDNIHNRSHGEDL